MTIPAGLIEAVYNNTTNSGEVRTYPCIINLAAVRLIRPHDRGTIVLFHGANEDMPPIVITEDYDTFAARIFDTATGRNTP